MQLFVNQRTGNLQLDPQNNAQVRLNAVYLCPQPLLLQYGQDDPTTGIWTPARLADPTGMIMGVKVAGDYVDGFATSCSAFTAPGSDAGFYSGILNFNTAALVALFGTSNAASLSFMGEVDWKPDGSALPAKSNPAQLTIANAIIRGNEGPVLPLNPFALITGLTGGGAANLDGLATAGGVAPVYVFLPRVRPAIWWQRMIGIVATTIANPTVVQTDQPHDFATGQTITFGGDTSTPALNGDQVATVIDATHFSVPVNVTVAGAGGFVSPATNAPGGLVRPADFDPATNPRFWQSVI